ncbi:MAG TPA: PKD domain-containing protein, partial [Bacteroidia bacterium]|nr:PKD domain-containing protein [Bacteroidia bacterium]
SNGSPIFYFNGNVNSAPVTFQAGVNNYYMYSSYALDSNNLLNFIGTLEPIGCNGCANTIKISINDYKVENNATVASFDTGGYLFVTPTGGAPTSFNVTFYARTGPPTDTNYVWNFGDGSTSAKVTPNHTYNHAGNYNVSLSVANSCSTSITNPVYVGTSNALMIPQIFFSIDSLTNTVIFGASDAGPNPPYTYLWNFGDGNTSDSVIPSHNYASPNVYKITLTATDKSGLKATSFLDTNSKNTYPTNCIVNYSYVVNPVPNPKAFSNINITYTDATGDVYSSAKVAQPATSYFQVLSVANYNTNENNQTTKKLNLQFSCLVKDSKGNTIPITNGTAVIAVAYK